MPAENKITDAEYEIMKVLWENGGEMRTAEIIEGLTKTGWKRTTISTLLTRLCDKGMVSCRRNGKLCLYTAAVEREKYSTSAARSFLKRMFGGSVKNMVAALYENDGLSDEELKELKDMLN